MRSRKVVTIVFAIVCVSAVASSAPAQKTNPPGADGGSSQPVTEPLSKKRLLKLLTLNDSTQQELIQIVGQKGVDFRANPSDERELHDAGASDELIVAVRANYRDGTSSSVPTHESGGAVVSNADAPSNTETAAQPPAQASTNTAAAPPPAAKKKSFLDKLNQTMDKANAARASQRASAQTPAPTETAPPAQQAAAPVEPANTEPPSTATTGTTQDAPPVTNATSPVPREPDSITPSGKVIHHTGHPKATTEPEPAPGTTTPTQQDETLPNGKVIHHTGHPKITPDPEPAPDTMPKTTLETMSVPGIMASPNNIALMAGKGTGQTTLTWNGGRAHMFAEVWVKVDDQDETKVAQSGQGTLKMPVVPGKTYVYTLRDKGRVLATITVQFHR